ncbi:uncharacterized protein PFL1_01277 [Pseudozyma flocculosa PF-1]|uniref:Uncharacterized protein n=1 Tax=Pseudozyma flocculosa TaxID=84751 RepID=A0A5C3EUC3_9BASI|nr:uncharacterized protein PFL1_01277 [Pseudozyma flocculosa PF-1]EPQ31088.1 hypothetical protein PFL1_01277 [Pseudozyma flocculosa PF-1]SPO35943.1 uncharacterized protein PSFLO_01414 [Pseudozyma flocculosa]
MSDNQGNKNEEQSFTIQPHPATTNDPNTDPALKGGQADVFGKPGPQIFDTSKLEEPLSKDELAKRSAELNK